MTAMLDHWLVYWLFRLIVSILGLLSNWPQRPQDNWWVGLAAAIGTYALWRQPLLALTCVGLGLAGERLMNRWLPHDWSLPGRTLYTSLCLAYLALIPKMLVTSDYLLSSYVFSISVVATGCLLSLFLIDLFSTFEMLDALCGEQPIRLTEVAHEAQVTYPSVSVHIPVCNEPVSIVSETLHSVACQDYPAFEVIVVYNNTTDEQLWEPIAALCAELGFKFILAPSLAGFKAGALNLALEKTESNVDVIAVVDSDYVVASNFLKSTAPHFLNPQLGYIQTRPGFRGYETSRFQRACRIAQHYFYRVTMLSRSKGHSVMFGGTVGLLRKQAVVESGGWDEACLGEDAELSLRLLELGYIGHYLDVELGSGLLPKSFSESKKQWCRWTIGGMQMLRKHMGTLLFKHPSHVKTPLSLRQRFHHLSSCLQWFSALWIIIFNVLVASLWGRSVVTQASLPLLLTDRLIFVSLATVFLAWRIRFLWAIQTKLGVGWREATDAVSLLFSLALSQAVACLRGLLPTTHIFERTSKFELRYLGWKELRHNLLEFSTGTVCLLFAVVALVYGDNSPDESILLVILLWLSSPYLCNIQVLTWLR